MPDTYYDILGVEPDADTDTVKRAYRGKVKDYHLDISDHPNAEEKFKELQQAHDVLTSSKERQRYDRLGHDDYITNRRRNSTTTKTTTETTSEPPTSTTETDPHPNQNSDTTSQSNSRQTDTADSRSSESTTTNDQTNSSTRQSWSWNDPITYAVRSGWQERLFLWVLALGTIAALFYIESKAMLELPPTVETLLLHPFFFDTPTKTALTLAGTLGVVTLLHQFTIAFTLSRGAFTNTVKPPTVPHLLPSALLSSALLYTVVSHPYSLTAAFFTDPPAVSTALSTGPWITLSTLPSTIPLLLNTILLFITAVTATWAVLGGLVWQSAHSWNSHYREGKYIIYVVWELLYILPVLVIVWLAASGVTLLTLPQTAISLETSLLVVMLPLQPLLVGVPYRFRVTAETHLHN